MSSPALFSVAGKVVLITGGSAGIGAMIARGFVERGARTYIVGRDRIRLDRAVSELSAKGICFGLAGDVSTRSGITELVGELAYREPRLDVLVNNAGAVRTAPLEDFSDDDWDEVLTLNVRSVFFLIQGLLPLLRRAAAGADHAAIVNIGSVAGLCGARPALSSNAFSYAPSKAAVHVLTRRLARTLGRENITVNAIAPGVFPTDLSKSSVLKNLDRVLAEIPVGRVGEPDDIAGVAVYFAAKAGGFVTGAVLPVDGAMSV